MLPRTFCFLGVLGASFATPAQVVRNGDFVQRCDTCATGLVAWDLSWKGRNTSCGPDAGALRFAIGDSADAVGFVEQRIPVVTAKDPVILTVAARIRTMGLNGKGASLNVACYDAAGGFLANKDMGLFRSSWIHGTRTPERHTLKLILPEGTAEVRVGAIVNGRGEAWFDEYTAEFTPVGDRIPDKPALAYVGAACDTIRQHALYRDSVDLDALRTTALKIAGGNNDASDRHLAVEYLLQALGDHHSFLMRPDAYTAWQRETADEGAVAFATDRIVEGYGYVAIPGFPSGDSLTMYAFADSLQHTLDRLRKASVSGWIVDLRENTGGNMGPMVCGLGPLLDPGVLGTLTDVRGRVERWSYRDGVYGWDDAVTMRLPHPVMLPRKLPIAVLTGPRTGSSGECTTISFIGNSRTRSFGQPTWGLTTGNGQFALPDGGQLFLASTVMGDRNGALFHGPILPDEAVEQPAGHTGDATLDAALTWLKTQR